jgi:cobalt-zinc-cadmium efflux system outer membrane protein
MLETPAPVKNQPASPPHIPGPAARPRFELPPTLPAADTADIAPPRLKLNEPLEARQAAIQAAYPALAATPSPAVYSGPALTLSQVQEMALAASPAVRAARANADMAYGAVIQAGLYPNPMVGYQVDAWQPTSDPFPRRNDGQQGGYIQQLVKTAGKLQLAQRVAGYDYINALVAVHGIEREVLTRARSLYWEVVVARRRAEILRALVDLNDELYELQLRRAAAGETQGFEPWQVHARTRQVRLNLAQAEHQTTAAWQRLAILLGQPQLPTAPLAGDAEVPLPCFNREQVEKHVLENHTEVLTARNQAMQAQTVLTLAQRNVTPDIFAYMYHQHDTLARNWQFGGQLGVTLPVFDRNQGNIHEAHARIARANAELERVEQDLRRRLNEAVTTYETHRVAVREYREHILPSLVRSHRALVRAFQADPDKVTFSDIIQAERDLMECYQVYMAALEEQWQALVALAGLAQVDDWIPEPLSSR